MEQKHIHSIHKRGGTGNNTLSRKFPRFSKVVQNLPDQEGGGGGTYLFIQQ